MCMPSCPHEGVYQGSRQEARECAVAGKQPDTSTVQNSFSVDRLESRCAMPNFVIFVSSTLSDLTHVRNSLGDFIVTLGYQAVLFERGDIPPIEGTLDKASAAEVSAADAMICIIGGRYGTEASKQISITELEIQPALTRGTLLWVFLGKSIHAEFQTYLRNAGNMR